MKKTLALLLIPAALLVGLLLLATFVLLTLVFTGKI